MITDIEVIDTGLDSAFNKCIIDTITRTDLWGISPDEKEEFKEGDPYKVDDILPDAYSDSGMLIQSFNKGRPNFLNERGSNLNTIAELILNIVLAKQKKYKFYNVRIVRVLWNYYNRSSSGVFHIDDVRENHGSMVYYLNTCDAYTFIEDKRFECVMGNAVLFKANKIHKGTGPVVDKHKFCMNVVFEYSDDMV
jgi:hypothetical protein